MRVICVEPLAELIVTSVRGGGRLSVTPIRTCVARLASTRRTNHTGRARMAAFGPRLGWAEADVTAIDAKPASVKRWQWQIVFWLGREQCASDRVTLRDYEFMNNSE